MDGKRGGQTELIIAKILPNLLHNSFAKVTKQIADYSAAQAKQTEK